MTAPGFDKVSIYYTNEAAGGDVDYFHKVKSVSVMEGHLLRIELPNEVVLIPTPGILKAECLMKEEKTIGLSQVPEIGH